MSRIGIVTVVTNEKNNLQDFFKALLDQTYKDFTLYFVDNNSSDGSPQYFLELNSKNQFAIKFIALKYNSGFSSGSNIGAGQAIKDGCEYLFIINNDVVMEKNCLEELLKLVDANSNVPCTGILLMKHRQKFPGIIQEFGGHINFKTGRVEKYYANEDLNKIKIPENLVTDFVGGGVCFIKADVFKSLGMFEEKYFGYFDEIDLSYRLKRLNNYKMLVTSNAVAYHNHNWTKKNKQSYYFEYYLGERNKYLYFHKFGMYFSFIRSIFVDLIKFPWRLIWFMKVCDFTLGLYYLRGMAAGVFNRKGKPNLKFIN